MYITRLTYWRLRFILNKLLTVTTNIYNINISILVPPGSLEITAPQTIILGQTYALKCTVTGGNPATTVKWLRDSQIDRLIIDDTITSSGNTYINEYEFTASADEHLEVFECQSENGVLQNPLSKTTFVEVYSKYTILGIVHVCINKVFSA